ncbi:MAG TPA: Omp28-related outer membrane protein, partial [Candidatus Kapabacteria bacterium]|nr:Omp28-related outer membrane protein [Candidatus Kapabacteria bacterium]
GAWYMDSLSKYFPNNAIIISWHDDYDSDPTSLNTNADNYAIPAEDTMEAYTGVTGFPAISLVRSVAQTAGTFSVADPVYRFVRDTVNKGKVLVDFRVVNVAFSGNKVEFDVDVTPLDMSALPVEDASHSYVTAAVITEDHLDNWQINSVNASLGNPIEHFDHNNVARSVAGKVLGDVFTLGTGQTLPVRVHYSMPVSDQWNPANLRIKAFVDGKYQFKQNGKNYEQNTVYNAGQSNYLTTYQTAATDAVWIVVPTASTTTKPNVATNIVWASGGPNQAQNVKLEYSIDNGTTWKPIIASTSASPYAWTIPIEAYGKTAKIQVTNLNNTSVKAISDAFPTPGIITVTKPAANDTIDGGTANYQITFDGGNYANFKTFSFSSDNGTTWQIIGTLSSDSKTYNWAAVPNVATTTALVRVEDANGVVGISAPFTIKAGAGIGTITDVIVDSVNAGHMNSGITTPIHWTASGDLGTGIDVKYTYDGINWQDIATGLPATATTTNWNVSINRRVVIVKVVPQKGISQVSDPFSIGTNSVTGVTIDGLTNNAVEQGKTVTINWTSVGEVGTNYVIEYSSNGSKWDPIADNVSLSTTKYDWTTDATNVSPTSRVRVRGTLDNSTAISNNFKITSAGAVYSETPVGGYSIANYPNPVTAQTNIVFTMAERGYVTLTLHDELGREVAHIASGTYEAGAQNIVFDASKLSAGVYSCTLETNGVHLVKKLTVTK